MGGRGLRASPRRPSFSREREREGRDSGRHLPVHQHPPFLPSYFPYPVSSQYIRSVDAGRASQSWVPLGPELAEVRWRGVRRSSRISPRRDLALLPSMLDTVRRPCAPCTVTDSHLFVPLCVSLLCRDHSVLPLSLWLPSKLPPRSSRSGRSPPLQPPNDQLTHPFLSVHSLSPSSGIKSSSRQRGHSAMVRPSLLSGCLWGARTLPPPAPELTDPPPARPPLPPRPLSLFLYGSLYPQDFKSATTGVAAKAMRNELNRMVAGVQDPAQKKVRLPRTRCQHPTTPDRLLLSRLARPVSGLLANRMAEMGEGCCRSGYI